MAKIRPFSTFKIEKREGRNPKKDWVYIHWNDGSYSWRRIYKSEDKTYIKHRKKFWEMFWADQYHRFNFKELTAEEEKKIEDIFTGDDEEEEEEKLPDADDNGYVEYDPEAVHPQKPKILTCIKLNIPVYLVGPAGTGKSTVLKQIATELGMNFFSTNAIQDEFKLTGFKDASGDYQDTEFYKAWTNGGIFFIDEMDASIPAVLTLLNTAIANKYFEFPNGRKDAHPDFRMVAAGNTFGNGADEQYTGRMVLDSATLDRFAVIEYGYDYKVELAIAKGNKWLVDFIEELRIIATRNGMRATFSYRAIEMIRDLEEYFSLKEVFMMTVFKGMDKDTISLFNTAECKTKYEKELARMISAA